MQVLNIIEKITGSKVVSSEGLSGGCIAETQLVKLATGQQVVAKLNNRFSRCEANGLRELSRAQVISIPQVIYCDDNLLILEHIAAGKSPPDFFYQFGSQLAQMHRYSAANWGFYENNYIGATPQLNDLTHQAISWSEFFWQFRLLAQYRLAEKNQLLTSELISKFRQLESRYHQIVIDDNEVPALLHGDLWSGNFLVDENGQPVLIDPAVYYGNREAELAMTTLFGGFSNEFYHGYQAEYPLHDGYSYREKIYQLYHLLNHLNLFGSGYLKSVISAIDFYI